MSMFVRLNKISKAIANKAYGAALPDIPRPWRAAIPKASFCSDLRNLRKEFIKYESKNSTRKKRVP